MGTREENSGFMAGWHIRDLFFAGIPHGRMLCTDIEGMAVVIRLTNIPTLPKNYPP